MSNTDPIEIKDISTTAILSDEEMENVKGGGKAGGGDKGFGDGDKGLGGGDKGLGGGDKGLGGGDKGFGDPG